MKVLYIVPRLGGVGGLQRVLLLKAGYLAENKGYDITILVTNPDVNKILFPVSPQLKIIYINPDNNGSLSYFFSYRKAIKQKVAQIGADIIVVCDNGLKSLLLPWILPKKTPVVYEMHAAKFLVDEQLAKNKLTRLLPSYSILNFVYSKFTKFVALTTEGQKEWQLQNSVVINNALWFTSDRENALTEKRIVVMGRHAPQKGYERMFSIWKKVAAEYRDWTLEIYGAHNPEYNLPEMARDKGLEQIIFSAPVPDVEQAYSKASISIMTSVSEPFGMALIEAMECGIPCVAYNCPVGPATIIKDGINGFLVEDNNEQDFINALQKLMEDRELRVKFGTEAKKTAARYNLEEIMEQWDALFKALTQGA